VDGVLIYAGKFPAEAGQMLVARLMVLAHLLTYRVDVPQEGRANWEGEDLRISVMPTAKGLRCAVRLPSSGGRILPLSELGLGGTAMAVLRDFVAARSGMLVVTGPAGSGKTTLSYALLTEILSTDGGISIVTLEDPVERMLPRVTQIEVTPFGQLTYERALRSMLRQDPQVLLLGEVRDPATAQLAAQAAMSGHRLICTLHADDPAAAIRRLLDMGVEPFQLTSSLRGVIALRLLRKRVADGYAGRTAIGEAVSVDAALREAIIKDDDASHLRDVYTSAKGHVTLREAARRQVDAGETDPLEVQRVLGT
jgi:type II secretory ATPase GspE/PulE/Tfp pilus assembly ATPase PilB-like protein